MWSEYNPNPAGRRTIDCTVRALCKALEVSWDDAYAMLVAVAFRQKTMPSATEVLGIVLTEHGFKRHALPDTCPACYEAKAFCADYPRGVYVLCFGDHVATVKNGRLFDTWNSEREVPQFYWTKEE